MTEGVSPLGIMVRPPEKQPVPGSDLLGGGAARVAPATGATTPTDPPGGNGKGIAQQSLVGTCLLLGDSCGDPELPRGDADQPLEVTGELALIREPGAGGDLRQGEVAALQELLGSFDSAGDD